MKNRINIVGYYGWGNFGDDLFHQTVIENRDFLWGPGAKARAFVFPFPNARRSPGKVGNLIRISEAVLGGLFSDTIAFCGGSVFTQMTRTQRLRSKLFKCRSFEALGVSFGPWSAPGPRSEILDWVKTFDRVVVRDRASLQRSQLDLPVSGDLAALHPMPTYTHQLRSEYVALCPSADSLVDSNTLTVLFASLLGGAKLPIKLIALNAHDDERLCHEVATGLSGLGIEATVFVHSRVDETIDILAKSKAVWSQRLHGVIVAYLTSTPFLALSHHTKIKDFGESVGLAPEHIIRGVEVTKANLEAARETLSGNLNVTLSPADYVRQTRDDYSTGVKSA